MQRVRCARGVGLVVIVGVVCFGLLGSRPAAKASEEESAADMTKRICSACHGGPNFEGMRRSRAEWEQMINDMVDYGMELTAEEREKMLDYLATTYGPKDANPPAGSSEKGSSAAASDALRSLMAANAGKPIAPFPAHTASAATITLSNAVHSF